MTDALAKAPCFHGAADEKGNEEEQDGKRKQDGYTADSQIDFIDVGAGDVFHAGTGDVQCGG